MKAKEGFIEVGRKDPKKSSSLAIKNLLKFLIIDDQGLNGEEVHLDLLESLLSSEDIDSEIDKVAVGFMMMSSMAAFAEERYDNEKAKLKRLRGQLDEKARNDEILGRPTDAKVLAWIESNSDYFKAQRRVNQFKRQWSIFAAAAQSFDIKHRMLQTKSANARKLVGDLGEISSPNSARKFDKQTKRDKHDKEET